VGGAVSVVSVKWAVECVPIVGRTAVRVCVCGAASMHMYDTLPHTGERFSSRNAPSSIPSGPKRVCASGKRGVHKWLAWSPKHGG